MITIAKTKLEIQKAYEQRTGYAAQKKYNANNLKHIKFAFNIKTDADILEKLEEQPNKTGYIKDLIRADIQRQKEGNCNG